ncbi:hypothetical protein COK81_33420 [Bacillus thuringiensis]|uniref:Resolvase HTH domain-containing protein n=1 Tax=Bacillus thuringiensis TaxID=1428 RepID=A0A9X7FYJ3_BACTU|nr:helix-turn-helix domain-containing protein [Bacillus thuringiensis]PFT72208.1 hypothetical protein COK81_33420 [Bacillus thuringiensis]
MLTKETLEELYVKKKMTQVEIGEIYNCDRKNIDYYLKKYNIKKRSRKESAALLRKNTITIQDIKNMIDNGMLIQDICEYYGVSRSTIYKITSKSGYNFSNHKNQTEKQSFFMKENNPFQDSDVKRKALAKAGKTKTKKHLKKYSNFIEMDFELYARKARTISYQHFGKGRNTKPGHVIDHKYSVKDGFHNKVPLSVISHPYNLREIPFEENLNKSSKSMITLDDLFIGVGVQRLSKAKKIPVLVSFFSE